MNKPVKVVLFFLCSMMVTGCATQRGMIALPKKVQQEIGSTDVYLEMCEKKIRADVENPNLTTYAGGGLLFALVDCAIMAHREDCADSALVDVQKEIATFKFQEKIQDRLSHVLKNTNWLQVRKINPIATLNDEMIQEIFKKAKTDCVLTSKFIYKLNPNFDVMTGTLFLTLYPASTKAKKIVNAENPLETPILKFHVSATEVLPKAVQDMYENAKLWTKNNGVQLRMALENILNQVFLKFERILQNPNHLPGT
ncbi:MAG: hypothetical protein ACRCYZ_05365 [Alphaproteobacteria bacterium]